MKLMPDNKAYSLFLCIFCAPGKVFTLPFVALTFILILPAVPALAEEGKAGIGIGALTLGGYLDVQFVYKPYQSQWMYGFKHASGTETFDDPFTGNSLTDEDSTKTGIMGLYLFDKDAEGTFYAGVELLRWSLTLTSLNTGESDTDSTVAPFIGGGYFKWVGEQYFYDVGLLVALGKQLKVATSDGNSTETSGIDIHAHVGIAF